MYSVKLYPCFRDHCQGSDIHGYVCLKLKRKTIQDRKNLN